MKIAVLVPKTEFTEGQLQQLSKLGEVVFTDSRREYSLDELIKFIKGAEIIAADPDNLGGFEKARENLTKVMKTLPNLKYVALATTSYGWIDLEYCKKRNILVSNVPGYSRESVAEHTLALLLCLAKRIIVTDRKTQRGEYKLEMGFELKGKTLGIIGLGNIGSRVAELGKAIGMKVIAYNRSSKTQEGVEVKSFDEVLKESDAIAIHVTHNDENKGLISKEELAKMKKGVIIVNTADREMIDEQAMAEAIKSGKVYGYAYEAEDLETTPLAKLENAVGIKGFGWYTKEAIENLFQILVDNISAYIQGNPQNLVV